MIDVAALVLEKAADAFLTALAERATDNPWSRLNKTSVESIFRDALANTIQRYSTSGFRLMLARPLLEADGPLAVPEVAEELTLLGRYDREPNPAIIGRYWREALEDPWPSVDFSAEAELLLKYLRSELRRSPEFADVLADKTPDAKSRAGSISTYANTEPAARLSALVDLMDARFGTLSGQLASAATPIRSHVRDVSRLLNEKTDGFVGRKFVFDSVRHFMDTNPRGYYLIRGDPGIGKTSLAAQLVKTRGCAHHFNVRGEGISRPDVFLRNVSAQLVTMHGLPYEELPHDASEDSRFLSRLLEEIAPTLSPGRQELIVVDALDEVDDASHREGANPLYLPVTLPPGVFVVVTMRRGSQHLRIECESDTLDLEQDSEGNVADVRLYVEQALPRQGIQKYIAAQGIDDELFVGHLVELSQGNFMYLRYVLPEIERGAYKDLGLNHLPNGLRNYYEDHWRRMRDQNEDAWFRLKLPILGALTVAKEPISVDLIAKFSGLENRARIIGVLEDFQFKQFLYEEEVEDDSAIQKRYRLYHASFHDFIAAKDQVAEERVNLNDRRKRVASDLFEGLYGRQ